MRVLLLSDMLKTIEHSGIGRALKHQMMALDSEGIEYTTDPKANYDIIHVNTVFPQSLIKAEMAKKDGKAVVYHAHSTEEDFRDSFILSNAISPAFKAWIKLCYSSADLILTPTCYSKQLLDSYGMDKPIEVVSNGIDLNYWNCTEAERASFRRKYGVGDSEVLIISVGLQIKRKGILDFIELAKVMPEYKFIWFGHTNPKLVPEEVQDAINTELPNVTFAGYVERDELRVAYGACDLYLFPTYEETEGIVLLEALASRANILVRDIPAFEMTYKDGINIYKASDNQEFEAKIRGIVGGGLPSLREEGYKVAQEKNIENVGKKLRTCYEKALKYKN